MKKGSKEDYVNYFNMAIDTTGWNKDFEVLHDTLFGKSSTADIDLFIKDHKKDPQGAEKFATYMLKNRPKGDYWFPIERGWPNGSDPKKDKGKKYEQVMNRVRSIVREEVRKVLLKR